MIHFSELQTKTSIKSNCLEIHPTVTEQHRTSKANKQHIHLEQIAGGFCSGPTAQPFVFNLHIIPIHSHSHSCLYSPLPALCA